MHIVIGAGYTGGRLATSLTVHGAVIAITSSAGTASALAGRHRLKRLLGDQPGGCNRVA